ncbi:peptide chain release factor N(5)-glutamine methyltransferase [Propylenella binzhouense]|uniref:Release factor glutamine methyltransferase n=1 Tax=Propylenella binzhouense TaxID=2555902 RepID=A0A964T7J5_9HYPH|nr:peptide chain release factor N(5)-glutamine methyltransferase [Propylenella binzhouense]MYZ49525.1 peptide chain release factor N(5)-glutamine methyltransferase [Propylenella binzhouense]
MTTLREALAIARSELRRAGTDSADLDSRLLVEAAAGVTTTDLIARPEHRLPDSALSALRNALGRRAAGEPVARILGTKEFWGLAFEVSADTLVPRPETEMLVEAVLEWARGEKRTQLRIADLGTGTGAILVALLRELTDATGVATDIAPATLEVARRNAARHGVAQRIAFRTADFSEPPPGGFDVVVSNPPYIRTADIAVLARDVRDFDPVRALDGGADGLEAYGKILGAFPYMVRRPGLLAFEVGHDQADTVASMCQAAGLTIREIGSDLSGHARTVVASALR